MQEVICRAIAGRQVIFFTYKDGQRTVEPHMVAYSKSGKLALSAWFLHGSSESREGPGWRTYFLDEITGLSVTTTIFPGARPGYEPDGGKSFRSIQCAL